MAVSTSSAGLRAGRRLLIAGGAIAFVLGATLVWIFLPAGEWLVAFTDWVRQFGPSGASIFAACFVLGMTLVLPPSLLFFASGLLYGKLWGFVISLGAGAIGSALSFLIARYLLRAWLRRRLEGSRRFAALDRAVRDESRKVVLLVRLAPLISGSAQNYVLGLTSVPFRHFLPATILGMVPWALLFTWLGTAGRAALASGETTPGPWQWAMLFGGLIALGALIWLVGRRAKARLREMGLDGDEDRSPLAAGPYPPASISNRRPA
jgi:uncharacterized membrane protein YdjX (TVP38/TMEM64 family)